MFCFAFCVFCGHWMQTFANTLNAFSKNTSGYYRVLRLVEYYDSILSDTMDFTFIFIVVHNYVRFFRTWSEIASTICKVESKTTDFAGVMDPYAKLRVKPPILLEFFLLLINKGLQAHPQGIEILLNKDLRFGLNSSGRCGLFFECHYRDKNIGLITDRLQALVLYRM